MTASGRLLIFGSSGFIGGNLALQACQRGWQVVAADKDQLIVDKNIIHKTIDITNPSAVEQVIHETAPTSIINCAALANIDIAEHAPQQARQVNVTGAQAIAAGCASDGIRHVYLSSDAVFDGQNGPYSETDTLNPVNYYGLTKAKGEEAVLSVYPQAAVVRISLVLGFPVDQGNSFLAALKKKLSNGKVVQAPSNEIRTPIDILTLCNCLLELVNIGYSGRLHLGCTESIDRYTLTCKLADALGYPKCMVRSQNAADVQAGRAPRHANGVLDISKAKRVLSTPLLNLEGTVNQAIKSQAIN